MEEDSISDVNNVNVDTFSNTSNTQKENTNTIFTNYKPDKTYKLVESVKNLTINDAEYYE